jgi:surfeit locus 1 family protein
MRAPTRKAALSALLVCVAFAFLLTLGFWQMRRLAWKEALLARVESRAAGAPAELPPPADWPLLASDEYDYRHVRLAGRFEPEREARIFAAPPKGAGLEPGYRIVTAFRLSGGGAALVLRGFVAQSKAAAAPWRAPPAGEPTAIAGHMRAPQGRNLFTPADRPAAGQWFTIDPKAMAAALNLTDAAPFYVEEDPEAEGPNGLQRDSVSIEDIPNNHLSYAVTWFGLAGALAVVAGVYVFGRRRAG